MMNGTYSHLWLSCLNREMSERTCGYWYTVTDHFAPHTAFRTRAALEAWTAMLGLKLGGELPEHGAHGSMPIIGSYRSKMHGADDALDALDGRVTRTMSNGQYTLAKVTADDDGLHTIHYLNPNCNRVTFDYQSSREREDAGITWL